jgi:antitoxin (DNA-binding transcriptional repressor) of toxin-antitoxin stability system
MIRVNIHDAKTHLSRYIEQVEQGEVVVVCRHNKPVAEIRVIANHVPVARKEGLLKGRVRWSPGTFAPMTDEELAEFDGTPVFPK